MGFEESLIRNAAPTLAGIKVANLYNFKFGSLDECLDQVEDFNAKLNSKGIFIELMKYEKDFYLLYVYRKKQLQSILSNQDTGHFLEKFGYCPCGNDDISYFIGVLKNRMEHAAVFPHEIGIFLGYPLLDVIGFIDHKGEKCVLCGEWKVYCDEQGARCFFHKLNRCRDIYLKVYNSGRSLYDMTVSA